MPPVRFAGAFLALAALALPMSAAAAPTDLDTSFGESGSRTTALGGAASGSDLLTAPGDKLVAVGSGYNGAGYDWVLARYGADGAPDETFDDDGVVMSVAAGRPADGAAAAIDSSGGVYFTGETTGTDLIVEHVDVTGQSPASMTVEVDAAATRTAGRAIALLPDGKVLVAGDALHADGSMVGFVARFDTGAADLTFGTDGVLLISATSCGPACLVSSLLVSGSDAYVGATALGSPSAGRVIRVDDLGIVDPGYGTGIGGGVALDAYGITGVEDLVLVDGRIVAAGIAGSGVFECAVTKLNDDGSVDMAFGTNGVGRIQRGSDCRAYDLAVDGDGRFTFAGRTSDDAGLIGRFTATGNPDSTLVLGGAAAVTPGGAQSFRGAVMQGTKLVVAGDTVAPHKLLLARYQGGVIMLGTTDTGSGSGGSNTGTTPTPSPTPSTPPPPADTTAPRIAIKYPAAGSRTTDPTPSFSGSASQDTGDGAAPVLELRQVLSGGRLGSAKLVEGVRSGAYWSATAPRLADGNWRARALLGDAAGNIGESAAMTVAVGKLATPKNSGRFNVVGVAAVGEILGVRATKSWSPATDLSISYRWERCDDDGCRFASSASDSDVYRVQTADRGHRLRARIYASNPDRRARAKASSSSAMVPKPEQIPYIANRGYPRVVGGGDLAVDDTLRADEGDWRGSPSPFRYSYRWQVCRTGPWCQDVGTGSSYRVRSADQGQRINLIVTAANRAGSNYAWSGTGAVVQGSRTALRRSVVTDSYNRVFGRAPRADELTYWTSRSENLAALVANHQRYIRDNRWMAEEVVRRAYEKVYGHGPWANDTEYTASQMGQFNADVDREWRSGATFDDLVSQMARDLANQALERIFFWRNDPGNAPLLEAHIRNRDVSMFVDRVRRDFYATSGGVTRGENLWTDVALSNDPVHGAARTSYPGEGSKGAADRENCYGAVGPGCTGVMGGAASRSVVTDNFVTLDGRKMSYLHVTTAVGSIAHDAMCRVYPWTSYLKGDNGVWCGDAPADPTEAVPIGKIFFTGAAEWNKATANTLQGRKWDAMYGPYPTPDAKFAKDSKHARTYSDDLRPAVRQQRWMELTRGGWILGVADLDKPFGWQGKEIRGSLRLSAPLGTILDSSDKDFCQARRFQLASHKWIAGQRAYNRCA